MTTTNHDTLQTETQHRTPEQLAARWNVCLETVRRKLRSHELAAIKLGRQWRIPLTSIQAYEDAALMPVTQQ